MINSSSSSSIIGITGTISGVSIEQTRQPSLYDHSSSSSSTSTQPSSQTSVPPPLTLLALLRKFRSTELSPFELQKAIKQYKHASKTNPPSVARTLSLLLTFIVDNEKKVNDPLILNFLLWQLAKDRIALHTNPFVDKGAHNNFSESFSLILSSDKHLPLQLRGVLHLLNEEIQMMQGQKNPSMKPDRVLIQKKVRETPQINSSERIQGRMVRNRSTNLAAIPLAYLLDGYENRSHSLRDLLHHTLSNDPLAIIKQQLEAFQSRERRFVFVQTDAVPIENYKMVMLYIIDQLIKDRTNIHNHFPENEEELEESVRNMQDRGDWDRAISYQIELVARRLIPLREKIVNATDHQEIKELISQFQKIYRQINSADCHFSICTCIDPSVFFLENEYKPIPVQTVPAELLNFATNFEIRPTQLVIENHNVFLPFSNIVPHANQPQPEALALYQQLKKDYKTLLSNKDREAMLQFLQTWCSIPSSNLLLSGDWRQSENRKSLKKLIAEVEKQLFGFCSEQIRDFYRGGFTVFVAESPIELVIDETYHKIKETYRDLLYADQLDPRKNPREQMIALRDSLRAIIDNPEYTNDAKRHGELMNLAKFTEEMLSNEPSQSYVTPPTLESDPMYPLRFAHQSIKEKITRPIPEIIQGVEIIRELLESNQARDPLFLRQLFTHLCQIKQSVQKHLINDTSQPDITIPLSINLMTSIDSFFYEIGERVATDPSLPPDDKFKFLTEIAQASYYLEDVPADHTGLKERLTKIQKRTFCKSSFPSSNSSQSC